MFERSNRDENKKDEQEQEPEQENCEHLYLAEVYYTGCPRRNVKYFGRVFLMLNYTDITQNTYIQS